MTFITIAVITALCLVFSTTRIYGVVGSGLLLYFQPYYALGLLLLVWIAYVQYKRRKSNAD